MRGLRLVIILIYGIYFPLMAQQQVQLTDSQEKYPLGPHMDILEDSERILTIQDVISPAFNSRFRPCKKKIPNFGFTRSVYWIRFAVKNTASTRSPWVLELLKPTMSYVDLFQLSADGKILVKKKTGTMRPLETRDHKHYHLLFLLMFPKEQTHTIYLRFDNQGSMTIPLTLWSMTAFMKSTQSEYILVGVFIGILLIMIGFNLFLLFSLKDNSYLYYTLTIVTILLFSLSVKGIAQIYLWPNLLWWNQISLLIFAGLMVITLIKFTDTFLLAEKHAPVLHRVANIYSIAIGVISFLPLFIAYRTIVFHFVMVGTIAPVLIILLTLAAYKGGFQPARNFFLSMAFLAIAGMIFLLVRLGLLPSTTLTENGFYFGVILFLLLMSLALTDRIKVMRTETERAIHALKSSEERFRVLVETTNDFIWETDPAGTYTYVSPKVKDLLGYEQEEMVGKKSIQFMPPEEAARVAEIYQRAVTEKAPIVGLVNVNLRKDGKEVILDTNGVPFYNDKGDIMGYKGIDRDITQRKKNEEDARKLQARVQHAQKLESLGILAGGIAHDFNNLLMGVLGNASLAQRNVGNKTEAGKYIAKVEKIAQQAAELTNQLLAYSGKGKFQVQAANLSRVVEEITQLLKVSISKKVTLRYDFTPSLPEIEADVAQLNQVIMNLVVNASEAMGEEAGVVSIRTGVRTIDDSYLAETFIDEDLPSGDYVSLEVSDNGSGMDEETQKKIFDPFFTTKFRGHGLGLAAVLGIVRGHKGTIKVYSEPGKGTTIKVLFPVLTGGKKDKKCEQEARSSGLAGKTVLIVDDEETVRDVVSAMLKANQIKVKTAVNGKEGVNYFKRHADEISMVLLDATMPEMSGEEAFRELRKINPDIKVVLTSGYNEQDVTSYFVGKGLAGFVQKPFTQEELLKTLAEVAEN